MGDSHGSGHGNGIDPAAVEEIDFATVRRGYEPEPVRARLRMAAAEVRRLNALVGSLEGRITELEATPAETLDSRRVAEALGDEATRVLQSATDAARLQVERAEVECARMVEEAGAAADVVVEQGRERGKRMVAEAQTVRERVLADLASKLHEHSVEVERVRVTRDRLREALGIFREGLDGWIAELDRAEPRAAAAAQQAALRVAGQPEPSVAELEAEIASARPAGEPSDARPGEEDRAASGTGADAGTALEQDGEAAGAGRPDGPDSLDRFEEEGEYADRAGLSTEPSSAAVRLYDVEAESDAGFDSGGVPQQRPSFGVPDSAASATAAPESDAAGGAAAFGAAVSEPAAASGVVGAAVSEPAAASGVVGAEPAAAESETGSVSEEPSGDAGAIFARLRSITSQHVPEPEPRLAETSRAEPDGGAVSGAEASEAIVGFADEPDELADEYAGAAGAAVESGGYAGAAGAAVESGGYAGAAGAAVESGGYAGAAGATVESDDLVAAARAAAVGGIGRRLKRLVVDEQGDLLDALRRHGVRAVRSAITGDSEAYTRAVRVPMQDFASDIDVSIDDVDLEAAGRAVLAELVEPLRERLGELVESTDDLDELGAAVRAIYRESRSLRGDIAAEAAFSAGWSAQAP